MFSEFVTTVAWDQLDTWVIRLYQCQAVKDFGPVKEGQFVDIDANFESGELEVYSCDSGELICTGALRPVWATD